MIRNGTMLLMVSLMVLASGCGQKGSTSVDATVSEVIASTPVPTVEEMATPTETPGELVEMQAVSPENTIQNVVGDKATSNASVTVVNQTGDPILKFYMRRHPQDGQELDWGEDMINNAFKLQNTDKMLLYYQGQGTGSSSATYDLYIISSEEDMNEFYFRNIPLETISRITLKVQGEYEDAIPYAVYVTTLGNKEYSTLEEVKKRLGLVSEERSQDSHEEEVPQEEEVGEVEEEVVEEAQATSTPTVTPAPTEEADEGVLDISEQAQDVTDESAYIDTGEIEGDSNAMTDEMASAENYVGSSFSDLTGALGAPNGSDYVDEPESGKTGYHYYGSFTVATAVDENGNEIVTGVW